MYSMFQCMFFSCSEVVTACQASPACNETADLYCTREGYAWYRGHGPNIYKDTKP
jgi:hypothetical protein